MIQVLPINLIQMQSVEGHNSVKGKTTPRWGTRNIWGEHRIKYKGSIITARSFVMYRCCKRK